MIRMFLIFLLLQFSSVQIDLTRTNFKEIYRYKKEYFEEHRLFSYEEKVLLKYSKKNSFKQYSNLIRKYPPLKNAKEIIILEGYDVSDGSFYGSITANDLVYIYDDLYVFSVDSRGFELEKDLFVNKENWNLLLEKSENRTIVDDLILVAVRIEGKKILECIKYDNYY